MTTTAQPSTPWSHSSVGRWLHYGLLAAVAVATAALAGTANPLLAVLPVLLATAAYLVIRLPLRWSAFALVFLLLVPDDTIEAMRGQWRTPFAVVGDLVHFSLDTTTGIPGLGFSGMEAIAVVLLLVWVHRKFIGSRIDMHAEAGQASVVPWILTLYVAAVLLADVWGLARGLPLAPWKLRNLLHPVLLAALFMVAFQGPRDFRIVGQIVVFAAVFRSLLAFQVQRIAEAETGGPFGFATSHGDSLLLAVGLFLVLVDLLERPDNGRLARAAVVIPVIVMGAVQNQRRVFWVQIVLMLAMLFFLSPWRAWKRSFTRAALVFSPFLALYVAIGWNSANGVFAPVQTIRSVVDTSTDHSAYWREVENWNIAMSMRRLPITGLGLGGAYTETMANDSVADGYKEYLEWPHNAFLGMLLLTGIFGFTAIFAPAAVTAFLSVRSYRFARARGDRVAGLAIVGTIVAALGLAWGDLGMRFPQYKVLVALAIAGAGNLAIRTGAWPRKRRPPAPTGAPTPERSLALVDSSRRRR